jgi:hypothetical protein
VIEVAVICGLVSFWFWSVLNDETGIAKPVHHLLLKTDVTKKWMICPFCSGAWFAIIPSLILLHDPLDTAIITAFAAAAIAGILGAYFGE